MRKVEFPEDCRRLRDAIEMNGYGFTLYESEDFWSYKSELSSAGWLDLPESFSDLIEEVNKYLLEFLEKEKK